MPQYFSPGVYVEEKDPGPRPIVGVSTSIAGAVGVTAKGPTSGKPLLVTSFADFVTNFGSYLADPDPALVNDWAGSATEGGRWWQFAHSVEGFFLNGGQQLFVKRVFPAASVAASANLGAGLVIPLAADAKGGADALILDHLIGLDDGGAAAGTAFRLFRGDTQADLGPFTVRSYDPVRNRIVLDGGTVPENVEAGRDFIQVAARPAGPVADADATITATAKAKGAWGNDLSVSIAPMVSATLGIQQDPGQGGSIFSRLAVVAVAGATTVTVRKVAGRLDDATAVPFTALIGDQRVVVANALVTNAGNARWADMTVPALPETLPVGTTVQRLLPANTPPPPPPPPPPPHPHLRHPLHRLRRQHRHLPGHRPT